MRARDLSWLVVLVAACSQESGTGGGGGTGGSGGSEGTCDQLQEWTQVAPHADYAECALPPNSSCDRESFCGPDGCGHKDSSFDANGCHRARCQDDSDCEVGQRCYDTGADNSINAPCAASEYACCADADGCLCVAQTDCATEKHCVDESEL